MSTLQLSWTYFESHVSMCDGIRNEKDETIVVVIVLKASVGCCPSGWEFVNLMVFP